jgi:hypothetical protein
MGQQINAWRRFDGIRPKDAIHRSHHPKLSHVESFSPMYETTWHYRPLAVAWEERVEELMPVKV